MREEITLRHRARRLTSELVPSLSSYDSHCDGPDGTEFCETGHGADGVHVSHSSGVGGGAVVSAVRIAWQPVFSRGGGQCVWRVKRAVPLTGELRFIQSVGQGRHAARQLGIVLEFARTGHHEWPPLSSPWHTSETHPPSADKLHRLSLRQANSARAPTGPRSRKVQQLLENMVALAAEICKSRTGGQRANEHSSVQQT